MRKSILIGTRKDASRLYNRNEASKRNKSALSKSNDNIAYVGASGQLSPISNMKIVDDRIVTFNHPSLMDSQ